MEPESPLLYPELLETCPYPKLTPSRPHDTHILLKIHLNIILPSTSLAPIVLFP
jgi:hypothetical protein